MLKKIVGLGLVILALFAWLYKGERKPPRYWVWAGVATTKAPADAVLYIYQGVWQDGAFTHKGSFPFPCGQKKIHLVYRIQGAFPNPETLFHLFANHGRQWEGHGITVVGLQIDYDSPSKKLPQYLAFLKQVKALMPPAYQLSITGLGDWLVQGDPEALDEIGQTVDEIIFQMYQHAEHVPGIEVYLSKLKSKNFSYGIGILEGEASPFPIDDDLSIKYYQGIIQFIQGSKK